MSKTNDVVPSLVSLLKTDSAPVGRWYLHSWPGFWAVCEAVALEAGQDMDPTPSDALTALARLAAVQMSKICTCPDGTYENCPACWEAVYAFEKRTQEDFEHALATGGHWWDSEGEFNAQ